MHFSLHMSSHSPRAVSPGSAGPRRGLARRLPTQQCDRTAGAGGRHHAEPAAAAAPPAEELPQPISTVYTSTLRAPRLRSALHRPRPHAAGRAAGVAGAVPLGATGPAAELPSGQKGAKLAQKSKANFYGPYSRILAVFPRGNARARAGAGRSPQGSQVGFICTIISALVSCYYL